MFNTRKGSGFTRGNAEETQLCVLGSVDVANTEES